MFGDDSELGPIEFEMALDVEEQVSHSSVVKDMSNCYDSLKYELIYANLAVSCFPGSVGKNIGTAAAWFW